MEQTPAAPACPLCAAGNTRRLLSWGSSRDIRRCDGCEALFTLPLPSERELHDFYQGFLYRKPEPGQLAKALREREVELTELFGLDPEQARDRKFLDQGGGTGLAYAAAKRLGLDSYFGDIDEQAIRFVQQAFELPERRITRDLSQHEGVFDYVFSDNVIEHVPDPRKLLAQLVSCLKPGGTAIIKTPHRAASEMYFYPRVVYTYMKKAARHNGWRRSLDMLLLNPIWACDPPRHLYSFSEPSLRKLAASLGLSEQQYQVSFYWTPLLKNTFLERALKRQKGMLGSLRRLSLVPVLPFELGSKAGQVLARRAGWITPGGLVLKVTRPRP